MTPMIELLQTILLLTLRLAGVPQAAKATANTVASAPAEPEAPPSENPQGKAVELYEQRAFEKALPEAEAAVEQAWKEFGGDDYHTIAAEEFLAHLAALNKDPGRAKAIREETDRKLARLGNPDIIEKIKVIRAEEYKESAEPSEKKD